MPNSSSANENPALPAVQPRGEVISGSRKQAWRILLPLGIGTVLALTGDLTLYAVLPGYAASRSFSLAAVGLLLSANRLIRLISNPLVGLLLAGSRRRSFLLTGFGLGAFSTVLYVLANGTGLFLVGRLLWGIAWSLIYIGSYTMLLDAVDEADRGWASGILQGFYIIGLALDPLLGGLLSDRLSFAAALNICAALSGLGFIIVLIGLPETLPHAPRQPIAFVQALRGVRLNWGERFSALKILVHPRNAAVNYIYFAANFVGDGILLSTLGLYLQSHYGSAVRFTGWVLPVATASGTLLALRAALSVLVAPLAGSLSDRFENPRIGRWQVLGCGLLLAAAGLVLIISLKTSLALLLGVILAAIGGAVVLTIAPLLAREVNPGQDSGAILGLLANSADLGMALAPLVTYTLLNRLPLETIYGLAAVMLAAGLPVIFAVHKT